MRNTTFFKTRISIPIRFSKDQDVPGPSAFCLTPVSILCTRLKVRYLSVLCRAGYAYSNSGKVCDMIKQRLYAYSLLMYAHWNDQCLVFVLACKMGHSFALCWFWEKKMWRHYKIFHTFSLIHTNGDLQKVARDCTPTDIMQCTGVIFIYWIYHEISAPGCT